MNQEGPLPPQAGEIPLTNLLGDSDGKLQPCSLQLSKLHCGVLERGGFWCGQLPKPDQGLTVFAWVGALPREQGHPQMASRTKAQELGDPGPRAASLGVGGGCSLGCFAHSHFLFCPNRTPPSYS